MAWLVRVVALLFLLLTYLTISADGMRSLFEAAATPLHKTGLWPLTVLGGFAETRRMDVAHVLCLGLLVVVWVAWEQIVVLYANGEEMTNPRRIVWAGGSAVLLCDAVVFFAGVSQSSFLGGSSVFAAAVITLLYVAMVVLVATWVNMIEGRIK